VETITEWGIADAKAKMLPLVRVSYKLLADMRVYQESLIFVNALFQHFGTYLPLPAIKDNIVHWKDLSY